MRYLRRFFENLDNKLQELEEFCELQLVYLLDKNVKLYVKEDTTKNTTKHKYYYIGLILHPNSLSSWDDVKDYYIPFLTYLRKSYTIIDYDDYEDPGDADKVLFVPRATNGKGAEWQYYSIEEVLNDKPSELDYQIIQIVVKVEL